jgi:hypothetical protein
MRVPSPRKKMTPLRSLNASRTLGRLSGASLATASRRAYAYTATSIAMKYTIAGMTAARTTSR